MSAYDKAAAINYAHKYAYSRNPRYLDFDEYGGDCTNFISQCIHAGGAAMNYTPTYGWYYIDGNNKAPAWTGVEYLHKFITSNTGTGPYGQDVPITSIEPADFVQLSFDGETFGHSLFVVSAGRVPNPSNILIATHTMDSDYRPLSTYTYIADVRYIHIIGTR